MWQEPPLSVSNNNFGRLTSDFRRVLEHCLGGVNGPTGGALA